MLIMKIYVYRPNFKVYKIIILFILITYSLLKLSNESLIYTERSEAKVKCI